MRTGVSNQWWARRAAAVRVQRFVGRKVSHGQRVKMLRNKATTNNTIRAIIAGQTNSQRKTKDILVEGVRISKSASHSLQRTLRGRLAFRNKTANMPPAKNTSQLNEPLNSTVAL
jgi:hypothetical protein